MKYRLNLLKAIIKNSFYQDTAHFVNNWGNILSVVAYMLTNILFIDIIYQNINTLAGYQRDEMLLFSLLSQIWFFILLGIFYKNFEILIQSVNNGQLYLILSKPIPSLFYTFFRNLNIFGITRDAMPSIIILWLAIDWSNIQIETFSLFIGIIILILGIACSILFNFLVCLPVFWIGESLSIIDLAFTIEDNAGHVFPFEGWNDFWKVVFTAFLPAAIASGISTSVILGKLPALEMLAVSLIVTIIFLILVNVLWKLALKNYTSASS